MVQDQNLKRESANFYIDEETLEQHASSCCFPRQWHQGGFNLKKLECERNEDTSNTQEKDDGSVMLTEETD